MTKLYTIKDVAKRAGVSITTVSFVLNGKGGKISKETKKRILEVCEEMNYVPNVYASSLKNRSNKMFLLIVPDLENNYYSRLASSLYTKLVAKGYQLLCSTVKNNMENELNLLNMMKGGQIDGLIYVPSHTSLDKSNEYHLRHTLEMLNYKAVIVDRNTPFDFLPTVLNDDKKGAALAIDHLISRGYKKIAILTGSNKTSSSQDRLEGCAEAFRKHGLSLDKNLVFEGDYTFETAKQIAEKVINNKSIDSIFAFNDLSAYAIYDVCERKNMKVGVDLGVVGFDDNVFSSLISPKLTTIRQDIESISEHVIDILLNDKIKQKMTKIAPILIERSSTR